MASELHLDAGHRRLHPSTLVFSIGRSLKNLLIPAALALFGGRGSLWEIIFLISFAIATVVAVIRYITLTWDLRSEELVVKEGIFFRSERHVPYTRIQNVDLVQNVVHRMFGVAEARLETASGTEPEAVLRVLSLRDVDLLRGRLLAEPAASSPVEAEAAGDVLVRVPSSHLVFLGLVVNRGFAVVGLALGLMYELDLFEATWEALGLEQHVGRLADAGILGAIVQVVAFIVAVAVVFVGFSIVWSLVRLSGFTVRTVGDDLRLSCGLLTKIAASLPRHRIQAVTILATWLHRLFGFASISVQTAGGGGSEETTTVLRRRFVPVLPVDDVPRVLAGALPGLTMDGLDWQPISKTASRRMRRRALIVIGLLTLPVVWFWPYVLIVSALVAALSWWHAGAAARRARYARTRWGIVWERGVVTRKTTLLPDDKIQTVRVTETPFDRRNGHRTLLTDAAGGSATGPEIFIRFLDADVVDDLRVTLAGGAATTAYVVQRR